MSDLKIKYLGLDLKNPIIVGACNLHYDLNNLKKIEEAGAAAIVFKSLFEEQLQLESLEMHEIYEQYADLHAEMLSVFPNIEHSGSQEYLLKLQKAKESVNIPLIASINCIYNDTWLEYAKDIASTGVDALELNFYSVPRDPKIDGKSIEDLQIDILKSISSTIKIPIAVKLSPFYANPLNVISKMDLAGAKGVVVFNHLFQPDIDVDNQKHFAEFKLSNPDDYKLSLRYAGLLYGTIQASICGNSGIYSAREVIKMILSGADCVQIVSTLYKNKISVITEILNDLDKWMEKNKYNSINDFKGKLSNKKINDPFVYKRAQYVDMLMKKSEDVLKNYQNR